MVVAWLDSRLDWAGFNKIRLGFQRFSVLERGKVVVSFLIVECRRGKDRLDGAGSIDDKGRRMVESKGIMNYRRPW